MARYSARQRLNAKIVGGLGIVLAGLAPAPAVAQEQGIARVDNDRALQWNTFAARLIEAHRQRIAAEPVTMTERIGGYAGLPNFYREEIYRTGPPDRIIARVFWEREKPNRLHAIELFFHDAKGRLSVDYRAAYLARFRNAPIQTYVNVHQIDSDLRAYRQFDASGNIIYEQCRGDHFGDAVELDLEEGWVPPPERVSTELYVSCFGDLPLHADAFLDPVALVGRDQEKAGSVNPPAPANDLAGLSERIRRNPDNVAALVRRGELHFRNQRFIPALADFDAALALDPDADAAHFGRGMVLGRMGQLDEAIQALGIYIDRNPESSLAYTKRGVRHIWNKEFGNARKDLEMAIFLDNTNAEAHDDLGVALAQLGDRDGALENFLKARELDPTYQKAHHNLGMVYFMKNETAKALDAVNEALRLQADNRSSLLLKATILNAQGRQPEAERLRRRAETLPTGNWSERSGIQ